MKKGLSRILDGDKKKPKVCHLFHRGTILREHNKSTISCLLRESQRWLWLNQKKNLIRDLKQIMTRLSHAILLSYSNRLLIALQNKAQKFCFRLIGTSQDSCPQNNLLSHHFKYSQFRYKIKRRYLSLKQNKLK